ncbi:CDP-alcohol phosphatidyltransferase family protein [Pseudokineococcus marinus]|uniref:CDP-alcohol phosphatidyltransferase family protein n=2 Tax=Pseudokineococcus marinus TaxID=351215 RepID=A0A849BSP6_9ACTN|nr:CDP-alcohol phosphatidyltransferase family protein [Pseudokineococcus marinus]NNH23842.1 CDP-alcohol phosphatidyltransferase family protein [Pseudokineococcus marinus]
MEGSSAPQRGSGSSPAPRGSTAADMDTDEVLTVPNAISAARLLLVPVFAVLIATERDGWALLVLMVSGASDWVDGYLARRWHQTSRLGRVLDPAADRLYIAVTLVGLAWRDVVPWWLVALIALRDVVLALTVPVLSRHGYGTLEVHYLGKAATFCLLYAFPLILLAQVGGALSPLGPAAEALGWAFAWWGTGLYWWAGLLYVHQVRLLVRADAGPADGRAVAGAGT